MIRTISKRIPSANGRKYTFTLIAMTDVERDNHKCVSVLVKKGPYDRGFAPYFDEELKGYEDCIRMPLDRNGLWFHENALYVALNQGRAELEKILHCKDQSIIAKIMAFTEYAITPTTEKHCGIKFTHANDEQVAMFKKLCDTLGLEEYWAKRLKEFDEHLKTYTK